MTTPLRRRLQDWLVENPAWESWANTQDGIWHQLFQLYEQGCTATEAFNKIGLGNEQEIEELKAQIERQHDSIVNQGATIVQLNVRLSAKK